MAARAASNAQGFKSKTALGRHVTKSSQQTVLKTSQASSPAPVPAAQTAANYRQTRSQQTQQYKQLMSGTGSQSVTRQHKLNVKAITKGQAAATSLAASYKLIDAKKSNAPKAQIKAARTEVHAAKHDAKKSPKIAAASTVSQLKQEETRHSKAQAEFNVRKDKANVLMQKIDAQNKVFKHSRGKYILTDKGKALNPDYIDKVAQKNRAKQQRIQDKHNAKDNIITLKHQRSELRKQGVSGAGMASKIQQIKIARTNRAQNKRNYQREKENVKTTFKGSTEQQQFTATDMFATIKNYYQIDNRSKVHRAWDNFISVTPFSKNFWKSPSNFFGGIGALVASPFTGGASISAYLTSASPFAPIGLFDSSFSANVVGRPLAAGANHIDSMVGRSAFMGVLGTAIPAPGGGTTALPSALATGLTTNIYGSIIDHGAHAAEVWTTTGFGFATAALLAAPDAIGMVKGNLGAARVAELGSEAAKLTTAHQRPVSNIESRGILKPSSKLKLVKTSEKDGVVVDRRGNVLQFKPRKTIGLTEKPLTAAQQKSFAGDASAISAAIKEGHYKDGRAIDPNVTKDLSGKTSPEHNAAYQHVAKNVLGEEKSKQFEQLQRDSELARYDNYLAEIQQYIQKNPPGEEIAAKLQGDDGRGIAEEAYTTFAKKALGNEYVQFKQLDGKIQDIPGEEIRKPQFIGYNTSKLTRERMQLGLKIIKEQGRPLPDDEIADRNAFYLTGTIKQAQGKTRGRTAAMISRFIARIKTKKTKVRFADTSEARDFNPQKPSSHYYQDSMLPLKDYDRPLMTDQQKQERAKAGKFPAQKKWLTQEGPVTEKMYTNSTKSAAVLKEEEEVRLIGRPKAYQGFKKLLQAPGDVPKPKTPHVTPDAPRIPTTPIVLPYVNPDAPTPDIPVIPNNPNEQTTPDVTPSGNKTEKQTLQTIPNPENTLPQTQTQQDMTAKNAYLSHGEIIALAQRCKSDSRFAKLNYEFCHVNHRLTDAERKHLVQALQRCRADKQFAKSHPHACAVVQKALQPITKHPSLSGKQSRGVKKNDDPNRNREITNPQSPVTEIENAEQQQKVLSMGAKLDLDFIDQHLTSSYDPRGPTKVVVGLANLSGLLRISDWVNAYSAVTYTENPNATTARRFNPDLDQAYIAIGNSHRSPLHMSIGKMYFPFGVYVPFSFTSNVNQRLNTVHQKGINAGYQGRHFYGSVYMYSRGGKVNQDVNNYEPMLRNWGTELGVAFSNSDHSLGINVNAGYLNNFNTTDTISSNFPIDIDRKGAVTTHVHLYYKQVGLVSDYTILTGRYNEGGFSYDNGGAKPQALTNQIYYHFHTFGKPSTIAANFQTTSQALALAEPKWQSTVFYAIDFNHHVSLEVQFAYWQDYGTSHSSIISTAGDPLIRVGTGKHNYMLGARLSIALGSEKPDYPSV